MYNGVVAKAQPLTTQPNLLKELLFTTKLSFTNTTEQQCRNGNENLKITKMPQAKTLSL